MAKLTAGKSLKNKIKDLENDQAVTSKLVKKQFHHVKQNDKPDHIVRNKFNKVVKPTSLVEKVIGLSTGLASGYLTKKLAVGSKGNILRRLLGASIQLGVTTFVAQHPKAIKSYVIGILKYIRSKSK